MKIRVWVKTDAIGSKVERIIDVEETDDDDGLEELAKDEMFQLIEWSWERVPSEKVRRTP